MTKIWRNTPILEINAKQFAKYIQKACTEDKTTALNLFYNKGLTKDVTDSFVKKKIAPGLFQKNGELSFIGKVLFENELAFLNLEKTATLGEYYQKSKKRNFDLINDIVTTKIEETDNMINYIL